MRLFNRKRRDLEDEERCPNCGEPVPDEADLCVMCGVDLRPLRSAREAGVRPQPERPA
jgi:predicted amidophosphoribosyltransferase